MESSSKILIAAIVLTVGSPIAYRRYEATRQSPFNMWEIRAGQRFDKFDADAERDMHRRFNCRTIEGEVRLCEAETGVAGVMRLAVDPSGRAMIVQWRFTDSSLRMTEEARRMAAEWTVIEPHHTRRPGPDGRSVTRWETADSAWSASMTDLSDPKRTRAIDLVDERRLRKVAAASAPAMLRLAQGGYLSADAMTSEFARAPEALAAAARELGAAGQAAAASAAALPRCGFRGGDTIAAGTGPSSPYAADEAALIEQVIPSAFPGFHLVQGRHRYLVDASGAAEEIRVLPPLQDEGTFAMAISFPRRVEAVEQSIRAFAGAAVECRAAAMIIVGRRDSTSGQAVDLRIIDADEEALASTVNAIEANPGVSDVPVLAIHYSAEYGTRSWIGEADWDAVIQSGPRDLKVVARHPTVVGRKDLDDRESAGVAVVEGETPDGLQLAFIRPAEEAPTPIFLPLGRGRLASGWMLIDILP